MNQKSYGNEGVSVLILAAGSSQRMGGPKPFLPWNSNENFIQKIVRTYRMWGCSNVVVVTNNNILTEVKKYFPDEKINWIENSFPELGRFHSVQMGLKKINTPFVFLQNIDNPFTEPIWLSLIFNKRLPEHWTIPVYKGKRGHPILLSGEITDHLIQLKGKEIILRNELQKYPVKEAGIEDPAILANINTPEEYELNFPGRPIKVIENY